MHPLEHSFGCVLTVFFQSQFDFHGLVGRSIHWRTGLGCRFCSVHPYGPGAARADMETGMTNLFASEAAIPVVLTAVLIHG